MPRPSSGWVIGRGVQQPGDGLESHVYRGGKYNQGLGEASNPLRLTVTKPVLPVGGREGNHDREQRDRGGN